MLNLTPPSSPMIILVHPQPDSLSWLSDFSIQQGYLLEFCIHPGDLIPLLNQLTAHLILLDLEISSLNGLDLCHQIRSNKAYQYIPIIALNSSGVAVDKVKFFEAGVNDYLVAPFELVEIGVKLEQFVQCYQLKQEQNKLERSLTKQHYIIEQLEASWVLSEERFHKIFFSSPSLLFLMSYEQKEILEVNQNFIYQTGYQRQEIIGETIANLNLFFDSNFWDNFIEQIGNNQEISNIELIFKDKLGNSRMGLLSAQVIKLGGQKYILFNISDITQLKQSEEFLQNSEAELLTLFGAMDEAIVVLDYHGKILKIAPTRYSQGINHQKIHLDRFDSYLHDILPQEAADFQLYWTQKVINEQQTVENLEYSLMIDERELWFIATISPLQTHSAIWVSRDITSRKKSEEQLKLFERAIASSTNGIIISDATQPKNPIIYVNPGFEKLTGYSQEEVLGKTCSLLQGQNRNQAGLTILRQAIRSEKICRVILENYRKDGTTFWNDLSLSPVFNDQNELVYYIGIQTDITQLKQAKSDLRKQFNRALLIKQVTDEIRQTLDCQEMFVTAANLIGETFKTNRCLIHTYAFYPEEKLPLVAEYRTYQTSSILSWKFPVSNNDYLSKLLNQDQGIATTNIYTDSVFKDIEPLFSGLEVKSILGIRTSYQNQANGAIFLHQCDDFREWNTDEIQFLESVASQLGIAINQAQLLEQEKQRRQELDVQNIRLQQEIKDKNRIGLALQESESKYRELVNNANSIILRIDCQGIITFFNEFAQSFFGYTEEEIVGRNIKETIVPNCDTKGNVLFPIIEAILNDPEQFPTHENENQLRNGDRVWIQWTNRALKNEFGEIIGLLSVGIDVTRRKQTQLALQSAKQAAEMANHTKSQFIARMSHELRTPLNAILGFTQILLQHPKINTEHHDYLKIINRSGEHLLNLINDILSISKIEAGKISLDETSLNLHTLLYDMQDMLKLKAEQKGITLDLEIDPDLPTWVIADEGKLRQILMNLLSNSVKFTLEGRVTLRVKTCVDDKGKSIQRFCWEVEDTGEGVDPQELPLLFEPFIQTESGRKSGQGTGLGLTICQQLIQLMGGEVEVFSTLGEGTLVRFKLPLRAANPDDIPEKGSQQRAIALAPNQPTYRILVVDDHWENRQLLVQQLQPLGFTVCEAEHGEQALTLWSDYNPDLIWMDLQMPVMDGYQATRQIRTQEQQQLDSSPIPILALTASAVEEDNRLIKEAGCNELIHKPVTQEIVLQKIADYLGVEYVYESSAEMIITEDRVNWSDLDVMLEDLIMMPMDWLIELHQATTEADEESIFQLVEELPSSQADLGAAIANVVTHFRLDQLLNAIAEAIEHLRQLGDR